MVKISLKILRCEQRVYIKGLNAFKVNVPIINEVARSCGFGHIY